MNVAAGNGVVYRYDGFRWTPHVIDDGRQAIRAIDRDGEDGLAAGNGGKIYERQSAGQWRRFKTPVEKKFRGVTRTKSGIDVAVGNGGKIVERVGKRTETTERAPANETDSTIQKLPNLSDAPKSIQYHFEGEWV